jgi:hypothetical protein
MISLSKMSDFLLSILSEKPEPKVVENVPILPITENTPTHKCCLETPSQYFIIFYDIDGVCHPGDDDSLSCIHILERICQRHENVRLVMSSTWRYSIDECYFKAKFPELVRAKTIGFTPIVKAAQNRRQAEVMRFVELFRVREFMCLDDNSRLFSKGWKPFYLVNGNDGLTENDFSCISQTILNNRY